MCLKSSAASSLRRSAHPKSTARIARSRLPSMVSILGLSEQVARLFPGEPVPCPVAGLADALEGYDSLGQAAIEQRVFGRFCGQLADRREPEIDGSRGQTGRLQNAPVLLNNRSAKSRPGFGRVPGEEILQGFFGSALGVR